MPTKKPPSEARQRFVRAANTRVNHALDEIRKIGKLKSERYEYTETDVAAIMKALRDSLDEVEARLLGRDNDAPSALRIIAE